MRYNTAPFRFARLCARFTGIKSVFLLFFLLSAIAANGYGQDDVDGRGNARKAGTTEQRELYKSDEILVKFKQHATDQELENVHRKHGSSAKKKFKKIRVHNVTLKKGMKLDEALSLYRSDPSVEYAEPNYAVSIENTPNDPSFASLWGLNNTTYYGSTDINAPEAWDMTTGSSDVVVAVLDTGIDYTHPDLIANIWTNTAELNGSTGADDDGNGYADDIHGVNTYIHTNPPTDDNYHGTHVAGTIGAAGNNGIGVAGVNWSVQIMACRFMNAAGTGYVSDAIECLQYVRDMKDRGANIVATNNSWGWSGTASQALYDAIAAQGDILFIAAAGNNGTDSDRNPFYPAGYDLPNVISVASIGQYGWKATTTNYGSHTVHIAAPGEQILSTVPGNNYLQMSGTSMAAPHVSGIAALLKAQEATRDWRQIKNRILAGGALSSYMKGVTLTGRRADAYGAMTCLHSSVFSILTFPVAPVAGVPNTISALSIDCDEPVGPVTVQFGSGGAVELQDDGIAPDISAGDGIFTGSWTPAGSAVETLLFTAPTGSGMVASPAVTLGASNVAWPASALTTTLVSAITGTSYSQTYTATGGAPPLTWSIVPNPNGLPAGLVLNAATGEVSGIPTTPYAYNFKIQVTDALGLKDIQASTIVVNTDLRPGWPKTLALRTGTGFLPKSRPPLFADINGDGKQEVVAVDVNTLYIFGADGLLNKTEMPSPVTAPVVADINGDGSTEIIVATTDNYSSPDPVYAFDSNLTLLPGFPAGSYPTYFNSAGSAAAPVVADLLHDGRMQIIQACSPNNANDPNFGKVVLEVIDSEGLTLQGWPQIFGNTDRGVTGPPAIDDIDGDGSKEIVVSSFDGTIYIFRVAGTEIASWQVDQGVTNIDPPVLADLDGNGQLSIVVKYTKSSAIYVAVFDKNGVLRSGWPLSYSTAAPQELVAGDIDGNGLPEIAFVTGSYWNTVQVLNADGVSLANWPVQANCLGALDGSPILADLDGNGAMDVLVVCNGSLAAFDRQGTALSGFLKYSTPGNEVRSTAAVGDLDGDNKLNIALKSEDGRLYVWKPSSQTGPLSAAWPMYRHDALHSGAVRMAETPPSITTDALPAAAVGIAYNQTLIADGGRTPYTWSLSEGALPAGLALDSGTGSITGTPSQGGTYGFTVQVTDAHAAVGSKQLSIAVQYVLSAAAEANGSISPSGDVLVNAGGGQTFMIAPSAGYHIADVRVDGVPAGPVSSYAFSNVSSNHTIAASFSINTYVVTPYGGPNGTISPSTQQTVNENGTVSFTISPYPGYHIDTVSGCSGLLNGNLYTTGPVTADCSVAAVFAPDLYAMTVTTTGTGAGTVASSPSGISCGVVCSASFENGTSVSLTATPGTGSIFSGWSGDCSGTGTCTTTMDAAKTATATFTKAITVVAPNGGESWRRSSSYTIRWTYSGNPGSNVKIALLKGGSLNRTITNSTSVGSNGSGSYTWKISGSQATGSNYSIRVTSTSNSGYTDTSDVNFTIR